MIVNLGGDLNAKMKSGMTPLQSLLNHNTSEELVVNSDKAYISFAITNLCSEGADVNAFFEDGTTPVGLASILGKEPELLALIKGGAKID